MDLNTHKVKLQMSIKADIVGTIVVENTEDPSKTISGPYKSGLSKNNSIFMITLIVLPNSIFKLQLII